MFDLKELFLFKDIPEAEIEKITHLLPKTVTYKKGEIIYSAEDFPNAIGFLVKGKAFAVASNDGLHMNSFNQGTCFGAAAIFGDNSTYVSTIFAESDSEILFVTEDLLKKIFEINPKISLNYISFLSDKIRFLNKKIGLVSSSSAEEKVLKFLSYSADGDGYALLPKSMTLLAKMLGLGRATLYRCLDSLEANNIILRENNKIKVIKNEKNS